MSVDLHWTSLWEIREEGNLRYRLLAYHEDYFHTYARFLEAQEGLPPVEEPPPLLEAVGELLHHLGATVVFVRKEGDVVGLVLFRGTVHPVTGLPF